MKKLIISLFSAALLSCTASFGATVTLVNKYDQLTTFAVSNGAFYNPVFLGSVVPGGKATVRVDGPIDSGFYFMAFPPYQSMVTTWCGNPDRVVNHVGVAAFKSPMTGEFTCRVFEYKKYPMMMGEKTCHKTCKTKMQK